MSDRPRVILVYLIAFVSGAVVMAFEILGSRMLAPFFGNTIFVWGSLISVFMLGLAGGYYLGGRLAGTASSLKGLSLLLFAAALFLSALPFFGGSVCDWIFNEDLGPRLGPLTACLLLFTLPTVFLGAVSPYLVQLLVRDKGGAGRGAGNLYAVSTLGSIAGTLGASFFLILWLGTKASLTLLGTILGALVLLAALGDRLGEGGGDGADEG